MDKFKLKIVTPERVVLTDEVSQLSVSTTSGQITILPHHLPLVSQLAPGEIIVKYQDKEASLMAVFGGFIEVLPDEVIILADRAEYAADIDEQRAEEARQRAEDALKEEHIDSEQFAMLSATLEKELNRLRVSRKYKKQNTNIIQH